MYGTIINVFAIIVGCSIGLLFHKSFPERIIKSVFQIIGLFTLMLGLSMAIKGQEILILIFSLVLGTIIGSAFDLDAKFLKISRPAEAGWACSPEEPGRRRRKTKGPDRTGQEET